MTKVSVIMSVYNEEKYLEESVKSILSQTFKNFEFVLVDDASTDESLEIIRRFARKDKRIKILSNKKRLGLTKSLNKALRQLPPKADRQVEYIARMDVDDISLPNRLKEQSEYLDSHPQIAVLGSWAILIDENGNKLKVKETPTSYKKIHRNVIAANPFIHPTLMFRRSVLEEVGYYDESFSYAQDYELILRILKSYKGVNIAKSLLLYRVGEKKSISIKKLKEQEWASLRARLKALTELGYPFWQAIYLIKPFLSFLIPSKIKLFIYKNFFWTRVSHFD